MLRAKSKSEEGHIFFLHSFHQMTINMFSLSLSCVCVCVCVSFTDNEAMEYLKSVSNSAIEVEFSTLPLTNNMADIHLVLDFLHDQLLSHNNFGQVQALINLLLKVLLAPKSSKEQRTLFSSSRTKQTFHSLYFFKLDIRCKAMSLGRIRSCWHRWASCNRPKRRPGGAFRPCFRIISVSFTTSRTCKHKQ